MLELFCFLRNYTYICGAKNKITMAQELEITNLLLNNQIYCAYIVGSHLYGSNTAISDVDYLMITSDKFGRDGETVTYGDIDVSFYSDSTWTKLCDNDDIKALEVNAIPNVFIIKQDRHYRTKNDVINIRKSISAVVSNAWVKGKKKLTVDESFNPYIGKKSIWHCFRILMFGIQVYKYGHINNFSEANYLYDEIVNCESNDWEYFKKKYQEPLNNLRTEFRKYSEAEWIKYQEEQKR